MSGRHVRRWRYNNVLRHVSHYFDVTIAYAGRPRISPKAFKQIYSEGSRKQSVRINDD